MWLFESTCVVCEAPANGICESCAHELTSAAVPRLLSIGSATALFSYEGAGAVVIQAMKFGNRRQALGPLVDALATVLSADVDAIVAVPGHPQRVRERGVDIPAVMARRLSRRLNVPVVQPLLRIDSGSQKDRPREERLSIEFRAIRTAPERVLLIDDVVTTGATAVACAEALKVAGARSISFAALAATPQQQLTRQAVMQ